MKVLVTGASGFVGKPLCKELQQEGYSVVAATRLTRKAFNNLDVVTVGEVDGQTAWHHALNDVDAVVHLAARVHVMNESSADPLNAFRKVNVEGTAQLARQAAIAGVKRFIYISSVKVNGECTNIGTPFNEEMKPNPQDAYGVSKLEAEEALMQLGKTSSMEIVIIRPPLVYGAGVKANFASMLNVLRKRVPLPFGAIKNQRSLIYVGNLVAFIAKCIEHPNAANQVFLISDGSDLSTTELLRKSADALGVKVRLIPIPKWLLEVMMAILGKKDIAQRLCGNLQVDTSKACSLLSWSPPISADEGLKAAAIEWLRGQKNEAFF